MFKSKEEIRETADQLYDGFIEFVEELENCSRFDASETVRKDMLVFYAWAVINHPEIVDQFMTELANLPERNV